jgi:hypothetical protein
VMFHSRFLVAWALLDHEPCFEVGDESIRSADPRGCLFYISYSYAYASRFVIEATDPRVQCPMGGCRGSFRLCPARLAGGLQAACRRLACECEVGDPASRNGSHGAGADRLDIGGSHEGTLEMCRQREDTTCVNAVLGHSEWPSRVSQ